MSDERILQEIREKLKIYYILHAEDGRGEILENTLEYSYEMGRPRDEVQRLWIQLEEIGGKYIIRMTELNRFNETVSGRKDLRKWSGLYRPCVRVRLKNNVEYDVGIWLEPVLLGNVKAPEYRVKRLMSGWTLIQLEQGYSKLYEEKLLLKYDGYAYSYPQDGNRAVRNCYVPYHGTIELTVTEPLLPMPKKVSG